jgi:hypothetical protein
VLNVGTLPLIFFKVTAKRQEELYLGASMYSLRGPYLLEHVPAPHHNRKVMLFLPPFLPGMILTGPHSVYNCKLPTQFIFTTTVSSSALINISSKNFDCYFIETVGSIYKINFRGLPVWFNKTTGKY